MSFSVLLQRVVDNVTGWPLIIYVVPVAAICTIACGFVQFRSFFKAWKFTLLPERCDEKSSTGKVDMTPLQAFVNALSTNLGNGSIAGVATAVYAGGPGAIFWFVIVGFLIMVLRFAEVFLSAYFGAKVTKKTTIGGPMLYLKQVIGGAKLAYLYAFFTFLFGLISGSAIQTNSIGVSLIKTWGISPWIIAVTVLLFILYVLFGGAARIVKISDTLVPIRVSVFFISAIIILAYHYQNLLPALKIICKSAFTSGAVVSGVAGFAVQQAIRLGMMRAIFATESGLGTAAILFGATGSKQPVRIGIMSMLSSFISICVCFLIGLCIVASGVWHSGETSTALTIASYSTVFGHYGGWLVSFLSVTFGIGVLVPYAYITREAWLLLTGGRYVFVFIVLYSLVSFGGVLVRVDAVWAISDLIMAGMLFINLFAILYFLPLMKKELTAFLGKK